MAVGGSLDREKVISEGMLLFRTLPLKKIIFRATIQLWSLDERFSSTCDSSLTDLNLCPDFSQEEENLSLKFCGQKQQHNLPQRCEDTNKLLQTHYHRHTIWHISFPDRVLSLRGQREEISLGATHGVSPTQRGEVLILRWKCGLTDIVITQVNTSIDRGSKVPVVDLEVEDNSIGMPSWSKYMLPP